MPDHYDRRDALKLLGSGALGLSLSPLLGSCASAPSQGRPRQRPNILFILTDDQTQGAMGAYGNRILKTPNMDRIGDEGIRFEQAFVTVRCACPAARRISPASIRTGTAC
jgi:Flp pilus assembly protein TadD